MLSTRKHKQLLEAAAPQRPEFGSPPEPRATINPGILQAACIRPIYADLDIHMPLVVMLASTEGALDRWIAGSLDRLLGDDVHKRALWSRVETSWLAEPTPTSDTLTDSFSILALEPTGWLFRPHRA
jgi:hypothetical protein